MLIIGNFTEGQLTRAFIVGNGPSLNETPLELLNGEHSWGVNRIHLIYPRTTWRPTYMVYGEMTAGSPDWFPKIWEAVRANPQAEKYARDDAWWWTEEMEQYDITRFKACTHHDLFGRFGPRIPDAWHFPPVCKYGGVVPMAIQLAVRHRWYREEDRLEEPPNGKYDEIYLVGCDLGHKPGSSNHFDKEYGASSGALDGLSIDEQTARKRREGNQAGHQLAFENSPIPIYNATIGGELDVYPRVEFSELFD